MAIDFFTLPKQLLIKLLQQANPRTLCRLRQTCSSVDQFAESYRFSINCRFRPHSLWIRLLPRKEEDKEESSKLHVFVMHRPVKWRNTRDVFEAATYTSPFPRVDIKGDPYPQLSALSFYAVVVDTDCRKREGLSEFERNSITSLLKKLRLNSEWLSIYGMPADGIPAFFPLVRFSNINFTCCKISLVELEKWPIQHCEELSIHLVTELPLSVESITNQKFSSFDIKNFQEANCIFTELLKAMYLNESARGNLKFLRLRVKKDTGFTEDCYWFKEIFPKSEFVCFIEARSLKNFAELHFLEKNSRKDLFSVVTDLVYQHTTPIESHMSYKEDFVKAPNEAEAIRQYTQELFTLMQKINKD